MSKEIAYLGLDVHKNSITLALLVEQRKEEEFIRKIPHDIKALLRTVKQLSEEYHLRTCYEASGCGFTIYRSSLNTESTALLSRHLSSRQMEKKSKLILLTRRNLHCTYVQDCSLR